MNTAQTQPQMSGPTYVPQVGDTITLELPDERTRAELVKIVGNDTAIARLITFTTGKASHNYRKGDLVPCRFGKVGMNLTGWRAVSEREMDEAEAAQKAKKAKKAKRKKRKR